jgi:hypothetical protein
MSKIKEYDELMDEIYSDIDAETEWQNYNMDLLQRRNVMLLQALRDVVTMSNQLSVQVFIGQTIKDYHELS